MKNVFIILFSLPVIVFSQPFDTGVRTNVENSWQAEQTFTYILADSVLIPVSGRILLGDADTYFYEISDDRIGVRLADDTVWEFSSTVLGRSVTGRPALLNEGSSAFNPNITPNAGDPDIGLGTAGADLLSIIAGGVEAIRAAEGAGNNNVRCSIYGDVMIDSSGSLSGNANIRGSDSFAGIVIADTILNDDFAAADMFYLQFTGAPGDSIKTLFADGREDTLIVNRAADGDADQSYNWWRIK